MKKPFILLALTTLIFACNLASPQPAIPPELTISLNPVTVSPYSDAILHVHAKNTGNTDWSNHSLSIGYAKVVGGLSMFSIKQVPVNLPAGQSVKFLYTGDMLDIRLSFVNNLYRWLIVKEVELEKTASAMKIFNMPITLKQKPFKFSFPSSRTETEKNIMRLPRCRHDNVSD